MCTLEKHLYLGGFWCAVKTATAGLPLEGSEAEPSMAKGALLKPAPCFDWALEPSGRGQ